ncbi:MAG: phage tail assembly protein [Treponemataceae bacterium]
MDDVYLKHPVTLGERTVTELHFQEPSVMHMMRTDGHDINNVGADVELVSALTGEPAEIIKRIHIEDWPSIRYKLQNIYAVFFGLKPTLAEKSKDNKNPT